MAEDIHAGVYGGDVAEDARADAVFGVGGEVFAESAAGVCAFVVVVAGLLVHFVVGDGFEFGDGEAVEVIVGVVGGGHNCGYFLRFGLSWVGFNGGFVPVLCNDLPHWLVVACPSSLARNDDLEIQDGGLFKMVDVQNAEFYT